jgi:hypothetical protein
MTRTKEWPLQCIVTPSPHAANIVIRPPLASGALTYHVQTLFHLCTRKKNKCVLEYVYVYAYVYVSCVAVTWQQAHQDHVLTPVTQFPWKIENNKKHCPQTIVSTLVRLEPIPRYESDQGEKEQRAMDNQNEQARVTSPR